VQPILSSSYLGYCTSSLWKDIQELEYLVDYLIVNFKARRIVLCGFSTGAQDMVFFMKHAKRADEVKGVILQAPVSDREWQQESLSDHSKNMTAATALISEGKSDHLLDLDPPMPITAYRFHSLGGRMTDDDMFSSDLTDDELREKLGSPCAL